MAVVIRICRVPSGQDPCCARQPTAASPTEHKAAVEHVGLDVLQPNGLVEAFGEQ